MCELVVPYLALELSSNLNYKECMILSAFCSQDYLVFMEKICCYTVVLNLKQSRFLTILFIKKYDIIYHFIGDNDSHVVLARSQAEWNFECLKMNS